MSEGPRTKYIAPYEPLPAGSTPTNRYLVQLQEGRTIRQHFDIIGGPLPGIALQHAEYHADLTDEERERVRGDAGVRSVTQQTKAMEWESVRRNRSIITYPGSHLEEGLGHFVTFVDEKYLSKDPLLYNHDKRIGGRPHGPIGPQAGYRTDESLSIAEANAIFSDPNVHSVAKRMWGRYTDYVAPYLPLAPDHTSSSECIVYFHEGHTMDKHFEWMGGSFRGVSYQHLMYLHPLVDKLDRVRHDPGVRLVVEADRSMRQQAMQDNRSVMTFPGSGFPDSPGYGVVFTSETYTLAEHLARTGLSLDASVHYGEYTADLTESQMSVILSDPNVHHIYKQESAVFN